MSVNSAKGVNITYPMSTLRSSTISSLLWIYFSSVIQLRASSSGVPLHGSSSKDLDTVAQPATEPLCTGRSASLSACVCGLLILLALRIGSFECHYNFSRFGDAVGHGYLSDIFDISLLACAIGQVFSLLFCSMDEDVRVLVVLSLGCIVATIGLVSICYSSLGT